jgi:hypothetical protein
VLAVVKRGITLTAMVMFGVTVPEYSTLPAPDAAVPTDQCVMAPPGEAVHALKSMLATGLAELPVTVHPLPDRATATRA